MAEFTLGAQELGETQQSDFAEFINIVTGRSVVSGADWGNDRIEFGLSGDGMVRIFWTPDGLHGSITSLLMNCAALLRKKFKESEKSSGHCI